MSIGTYTICAFAENSPGVLQRITILFTKRKLNIESLTVSETERKGISTFTIVVKAEQDLVQKVAKQIHRVIEVFDVFVSDNQQLLFKELAFFKLSAAKDRAQIEEIAKTYAANVTTLDSSNLVLEKVGSEEEINELFNKVEPFGIKQFVRTGRIAILKSEREQLVYSAPSATSNFFAKPD